MVPGDLVVYLEDPLMYGKLLILEVTKDMRLLCECLHADKRGDYAREIFDPAELELAQRWEQSLETIPPETHA